MWTSAALIHQPSCQGQCSEGLHDLGHSACAGTALVLALEHTVHMMTLCPRSLQPLPIIWVLTCGQTSPHSRTVRCRGPVS